MLYAEYKAQESSEKIGLVVLEASKRLMGWTLYSGSIYSISGDYPVITSLSVSGVDLTEVASIGAVTAGKFYNDRTNQVIYMRSSGSVNPNGLFTHIKFKLFFSNNGVKLAHDLDDGFEVEWLPLVKSTSEFGVTIDNQYQLGVAIEGSGNVAFFNDQAYWAPKFDKLYFENQRVWIYSWNRGLPASEAKIIFQGRIQGKSWTPDAVTFNLKDQLNELRAPVSLDLIGDIVGARVPDSLAVARQRLIYGYIYGHVGTPIDQVLDGYPLTGTITLTISSQTVTGSGTAFLAELSPGDQIWTDSADIAYTVQSVASDTSLTITEAYTELTESGLDAYVKPERDKPYTNRVFSICGHAIRQPETTVINGLGANLMDVADGSDIVAGDLVTVNDESAYVEYCSGNRLKLLTNLSATPAPGDDVKRLGIQRVFINKDQLTYSRDYDYDKTTGILTLTQTAEKNIAPVKKLTGNISFTSTSRTITGTSTVFTSELRPGDWVRSNGEVDYFEILSITDDTNALLRTAATYTHNTTTFYKSPEYFGDNSVLSCDSLGITDDGLYSGNLIATAPNIVRDLIERVGLTVNASSFDDTSDLIQARIGVAIPQRYTEENPQPTREIINKINQSVFGVMYQNSDFELSYSVIQPNVPDDRTVIQHHDIIKFTVKSDSQRIVKTAIVRYNKKEYDYLSGGESFQVSQKTSDDAQYLAENANEKVQETLLVDVKDADIFAARWSFILEHASSVLDFDTKLQGMELSINDTVEIIHEKMYERIGSSLGRKIGLVHEVKKSALDSSVALEDLSNAFSRIGHVAPDSASSWDDASDSARFDSSFVTDEFGMIDNSDETFGINQIW